jgi:hypothetical protein
VLRFAASPPFQPPLIPPVAPWPTQLNERLFILSSSAVIRKSPEPSSQHTSPRCAILDIRLERPENTWTRKGRYSIFNLEHLFCVRWFRLNAGCSRQASQRLRRL